MKTECPKCASQNAWYIRTHCDLVLKCWCGFERVMFTTLESAEIMVIDAGADVTLPRDGTKLRKTLMALVNLEAATSGEIKQRLDELGEKYTASDVASYLTILRSKGLVETTEVRRGLAGGSSWKVTDACTDLL